ncbi:D-hexose-6-phosphate mutarotase [uncultured Cocleimonas sp.]|uniref:D-hexose-6-phosphate mutarotase n=1 Tax=uncultured Cocleimonas sp. TaxID=1051587 RepID=UPI00260C325C|nr:D-hexose-6-phosphate mutarotase [uncultured Cocleimonas sp.]
MNTTVLAEGKNSFPMLQIDNNYATALISLYGAQVLSFKPKSQMREMLFVSDNAYYEKGKAIKGGIPICWPWFGDDPENLGRTAHGFARNTLWHHESTTSTTSGETQVTLCLNDTETTQKLWPHAFKLTLLVTIGKTLSLSLQTTNTGNDAFTITQALHTYFAIGDIKQTHVAGLDKVHYIDKTVKSDTPIEQMGDVIVDQEVDRIYTDAPSEITLCDEKNQQIKIRSSGSKTTVVWNPWAEGAAKMGDLSDDGYQYFICVETANAASDTIQIAPQESFKIEVEYTVIPK